MFTHTTTHHNLSKRLFFIISACLDMMEKCRISPNIEVPEGKILHMGWVLTMDDYAKCVSGELELPLRPYNDAPTYDVVLTALSRKVPLDKVLRWTNRTLDGDILEAYNKMTGQKIYYLDEDEE